MTRVKFIKSESGYSGLIANGHTDFAEYGTDIVCAAVSSILQSLVLGLTVVVKIDAMIKKNDSRGYLEIRLPKNTNDSKFEKAQILFETAFVSLCDLESGYPSNIKVEEA